MFGAHYDLRRGILRQLRWPATLAILAVNVLVYLVEYWLERFRPAAFFHFMDHFALSIEGVRQGHVWQLLTFQFLHGGFWHLVLNGWTIYLFGRVVEMALGRSRMLGLYFFSGIMGGVLQIAGPWLLPRWIADVTAVGASAGACGLLAAFAVLMPQQRLVMIFPVPLVLKARTLVLVVAIISFIGIIIPFANIGHAAHLGGIISGWLTARMLARPPEVPPVIGIDPKTSLKINPSPE